VNHKERVFTALRHKEADRIPLNIWMIREDVQDEVLKQFAGLDEFYDALGIDICFAFPGKWVFPAEWTKEHGRPTLQQALQVDFNDPADPEIWEPVKREVEKHGGREGRCVMLQTPGVFEAACGILQIENALLESALHPKEFKALMEKIADWSIAYTDIALDIGIDIPHFSDDWGQNNALMISPASWREMVYPPTERMVRSAKRRCEFVSFHCDGDFRTVVDWVIEAGIDVIHPIQESAGMDQRSFKRDYGDRLAIHGGLDIRYYLPRAPMEELEHYVRSKVRDLKPGGGFIFNTAHTVQPDTSMDRVLRAYEIAREEGRY